MTDMDGVPVAKGPTIRLLSGHYLDLTRPQEARFTIHDVAHALAHLCRFTGHTRKFYSVAEHSVLASMIVPKEDALAALMHDAAEAFVGDVSKPLKAILPGYEEIEDRVAATIAERFGLPFPFPPSVKAADLAMLQAEREWALGCREDWPGLEGIEPGPPPEFWQPHIARRRFLHRFRELTVRDAP